MRQRTLVFCCLENTLDPDLSRSTYADASHGSYRIHKRYPDLGTLEDPWFWPIGALPLCAAAPPLEAPLHARAGQRVTATRLAAQAVPTQPARACPAAPAAASLPAPARQPPSVPPATHRASPRPQTRRGRRRRTAASAGRRRCGTRGARAPRRHHSRPRAPRRQATQRGEQLSRLHDGAIGMRRPFHHWCRPHTHARLWIHKIPRLSIVIIGIYLGQRPTQPSPHPCPRSGPTRRARPRPTRHVHRLVRWR